VFDLNEPVAFFLLIMSIILVTLLLSERVRLPGIIGIILGGMLIGPHFLFSNRGVSLRSNSNPLYGDFRSILNHLHIVLRVAW
jgi:Kef-type K+ transport system membrane component KefB